MYPFEDTWISYSPGSYPHPFEPIVYSPCEFAEPVAIFFSVLIQSYGYISVNRISFRVCNLSADYCFYFFLQHNILSCNRFSIRNGESFRCSCPITTGAGLQRIGSRFYLLHFEAAVRTRRDCGADCRIAAL